MPEDGDEPWPQHLLDRVMQPPPKGCSVVDGSTPVVSFGDPLKAGIATLGINPSSGEFLDRSKRLLSGDKRRLATLESIGAGTYADIDLPRASQILDDCAGYFDRRPYGWFKVLDEILMSALSASYFDGTACHLDLVQWSTDPVWQGLPETAQERLLSSDRPFLARQLQHEAYRMVVVAGRTAMTWVERAGIVRWQAVERLDTPPSATFHVGDAASPRFVGWSCNVQSQPGARRHISSLIRLLRQHARDEGDTARMEQDGTLAKGTHFASRPEMVVAIQRWFDETDDETIGDVERFARAPWINFDSPAGLIDLNADTSRRAIDRMLEQGRSRPNEPWHVIENQRGKVNKVVFSLDDSHEGWYAYLRDPLGAPTTL